MHFLSFPLWSLSGSRSSKMCTELSYTTVITLDAALFDEVLENMLHAAVLQYFIRCIQALQGQLMK